LKFFGFQNPKVTSQKYLELSNLAPTPTSMKEAYAPTIPLHCFQSKIATDHTAVKANSRTITDTLFNKIKSRAEIVALQVFHPRSFKNPWTTT